MKVCVNCTRSTLNRNNRMKEPHIRKNVITITDSCTTTGISNDDDMDSDNYKKMQAVTKRISNKNPPPCPIGLNSPSSTADSSELESVLQKGFHNFIQYSLIIKASSPLFLF